MPSSPPRPRPPPPTDGWRQGGGKRTAREVESARPPAPKARPAATPRGHPVPVVSLLSDDESDLGTPAPARAAAARDEGGDDSGGGRRRRVGHATLSANAAARGGGAVVGTVIDLC
jgi:hypothetical protein